MGRHSYSRSRSRSPSKSSRRRRRSRSRSIDRDRRERRDRSRDRKHRKQRKERRRSRTRSRSRSPISRPHSPPGPSAVLISAPISPTPLVPKTPPATTAAVGAEMPEDVKRDLCVKDWDPNKMSGAALRWVGEQVTEQMNARIKELDEVVRERVQKTKLELEVRLRAQIEQEWKEEMEAVRRREQDALNRAQAKEQALEAKLREVDEEKAKLAEERLQMLSTKSKLEMERNDMREELEKMKKNEQHTIINKGGFQRAPIRLQFGSKS